MDALPASFRWAFQWSRAEYARVLAELLRYRRKTRAVVALEWTARIAAALILLLVGLIVAAGQAEALRPLIPWFVLLIAVAAIVRWGVPWIRAAQYPSRGRGRIEFWADDVEVGQSSPLASSSARWSALERVVETDRALLFYLTPTAAFYVPTRIVDAASLVRFRAFVASRREVLDRRKRQPGPHA